MFNVYIYYLSVNVCMCNIKNTKKKRKSQANSSLLQLPGGG